MRYPPAILLAFAIVTLNVTAYRASKLTIALFAATLGAGPFDVGFIVSLYALFPLALAVFAGRLTDRAGPFLPMAGGTLGLSLGLAVPWLWPALPALYLSAGLLGCAYVFFHVSIQMLVGASSTPQTRTRNYATYSMFIAFATLLGPLGAGYAIDKIGHAGTYLCIAAIPLATLVLLVAGRGRMPRRGGSAHAHGTAVFDLLRIPALRRILLTSGLILTGIDLFAFYLPIYGHEIGLSATVIGRILAMFAAATFVVRAVMQRLVDRYSEERLLVWSLGLAGITYLLFPFFTDPWVLGGIAFVLGLGLGCGQPLSTMLTYTRAPEGRSGEALGLRLTVNYFTHVVVPLAFGAVGAAFGLAPVFWTNALLLAGGGYLGRPRR